MNSIWFMVALAVMQIGATTMLSFEGRYWLAGVYFCYGISNLLLIGVSR